MWGDDFHGGPAYKGRCPICEKSNGDVYDVPHEDCILMQPVKCPSCLDMVAPDQIIHGICTYCFEQSINELT